VKRLPPLSDREGFDPVAATHDGESPARSRVRLANDDDAAGAERFQHGGQHPLLIVRRHQVQHIEQQNDVSRWQACASGIQGEHLGLPFQRRASKCRDARPRFDADHRVEAGRRRSNPGTGA